jgi:hypothetical protein
MPCAPNRIAPPIVPMTGHLYRGYGLRGGRGSGEEGVSHERGRDPGTAVRAFREPPTAAPEQYPGGGDHGGEENGPEVGVVDLLAVHHLPSDVGRGRRGRAHAPRDVLKSNSSSLRKKSAVAQFAASSLFMGSEKGYRSIVWESVRGSNLQKSCDCLSTRSDDPARTNTFFRRARAQGLVSPRVHHQSRRLAGRLSLFLPRVDVRKAQPRCRLTTTSSPMRTSRRTGKVSPAPAACAPGSTRPAVRKADGESHTGKSPIPRAVSPRTAAAPSARRRPAKATRRAVDLSSARCERS